MSGGATALPLGPLPDHGRARHRIDDPADLRLSDPAPDPAPARPEPVPDDGPDGPDDGVTALAVADETGFVAFYEAVYPRVVAQVLPVVTVLAEAEDVTQEALVRAAARWDRIRDYDAPEAWVRRVALNLAVSSAQRQSRRARLLMRGPRPVDSVPGPSVERLAVVQALAGLPLRYRTVLALHYMADLSIQEVADTLDLPAATVRTRLARGRRRLAAALGDDHDASGAAAREGVS